MTDNADHVPVLVVDDDEVLTRTLEDILPLHGFAPLTAQSGGQALALARQAIHTPPVAVVDLRLPDMDGLDLAVRLHAHSVEMQVVILTGNGTLESAIRALRDEECDYLLKPVDPEQLIRTLRTAEGRWRLRQARDELHQTQRLLSAVFDASPLPIAVLNDDLTVRLWNGAAEQVFRVSAGELVGQPMPRLEHAIEGPAHRLLNAVLRGRQLTGVDLQYRRPDNTVVDLRLSAARLADHPDSPGALVAMFEDTTTRRRLETQLQDAQRLDSLGRLAGGVAHDFNNLLAVILAEAETGLQEPGLSPAIRPVFEGIAATAHRGATLTRQLLSFARRQPTEPTRLDLNQTVVDLERLLRRLAGSNVECHTRLAEGLWSTIADRGQLEQVLTNLVVNARDAMPNGGTATIETCNVSKGRPGTAATVASGDWVRISVSDTGTGIPDDVRARLFEPFFTTKPRGTGTGLGLATCHGIVERFQGVITVDSTLGQGSTFNVYLPRAQEANETRKDSNPIGSEETKTILLVEDQPQIRAVANAMLIANGYEVVMAATVADAFRAASEMHSPPDLVISDLNLPDGDGRVLLTELRTKYPTVRTLLTSGAADLDNADHRGHSFLGKPYSLDQMAAVIRGIFEQPI
ncbi:MAG: hybrid sensor histidine kinase/response regulator [Gemmatimonadales bacterium]